MTLPKPLLLTAIVAVSAFFSCNQHATSISNSKQRDSVSIPNDTLPDSIKLNKQVAQLYVNNYTVAGIQLQAGADKPNSRCFWISLKRLNGLVAKLNREKADGIRLYFAAYNKMYSLSDKSAPAQKYWGHNTIVIVSTKDSTVGKPGKDTTYHADYYTDIVSPVVNEQKNPGQTLPENRGEICPPPSNCYTQGAYLLSSSTAKGKKK